jgi:tRNA-dihydrouridine synthase 3
MADDPNPVDGSQSLKRPLEGEQTEEAHPPQPILAEDSAVTKAEKVERHGAVEGSEETAEPSAKRTKLEESGAVETDNASGVPARVKGVARIKAEYVSIVLGRLFND